MRSRQLWKRRTAAVTMLSLAVLVYLANTSWRANPVGSKPYLIAHRALGQAYDRTGLTGRTCTASRMIPTGHGYLENTLSAMAAAFEYGADAVELDVHPTVRIVSPYFPMKWPAPLAGNRS